MLVGTKTILIFAIYITYKINVYAGFTTGDHTWLPVADDYKTNNALMQLRAPHSHLQIFKKLTRLRKEPSFQDGVLKIQAILDDIIIYSRYVTEIVQY